MSLTPPRRYWLTGASSGIGAALALELLNSGAQVALSSRTQGPLEALAQRFPGQPTHPVLPIQAEAAGQDEQEGQGMFGRRHCADAGRVTHFDAVITGCAHIHVIQAAAGAADDAQVKGFFDG